MEGARPLSPPTRPGARDERRNDRRRRHYRGTLAAQLQEIGRTLADTRNRFQSIDDEKRLIEELLPRFRAFEAEGIIGPEARLDWVEALRAASHRLGLPELRYALSAPGTSACESCCRGLWIRSLPLPHGAPLGLLHEEDLIRLFVVMERESPGLFSVSGCQVRRAGTHSVHLPGAANLRATCTLEWFTLRPLGKDAEGLVRSPRLRRLVDRRVASFRVECGCAGPRSSLQHGRGTETARCTARGKRTARDIGKRAAGEPAEVEFRLTVNGLVARETGPDSVWINGERVSRDERTSEGFRVQREAGARVHIILPRDEGSIRLKAGQKMDLATGAIQDAYEGASEGSPSAVAPVTVGSPDSAP